MRSYVLACRLLAATILLCSAATASAAPDFEVRLDPSEPMPVVNRDVRVAVSVTYRGSAPIATTALTVEHVRPDGHAAALKLTNAPSTLQPGQTVTAEATFTPALSGFHRFQVRFARHGQDDLVLDAGQLPVLTQPLPIMYWRAPRFIKNLTWRLCLSEEDVSYWSSRGVVAARWAPGVVKRKQNWTRAEFVERWSQPLPEGYTAIAIDEFGGIADTPIDIEMSNALMQLKDKDPDRQVAVWSIKFHPDSAQTRAYKEAADLVMLEVYSSHFAAHGRFASRWEDVKSVDLANKTIFALWFDRVLTTERSLHQQIRHIRRAAPESRGICFNGNASDALFQAADRLVHEYFVKPVLLVEVNDQGQWQGRNIGWMTARNVRLPTTGSTAAQVIPAVEPGAVIDLGIRGSDPLTLPPSDNYTWLPAEEDVDPGLSPSAEAPTPDLPAADEHVVEVLSNQASQERAQTLMRLPVDAELFEQPFALTFDIAFESVRPYGIIAVGLGNDQLPDYTDDFLKYFGSSTPWPGRMEMRFYRGDLEIGSPYKIKGARGDFGYESATGDFVRTTSAMSFDAGKTYRVRVSRGPASVEVAVTCLDDTCDETWHSGEMEMNPQASFNEIYLRVREGSASSIALHPDRNQAVLQSGTKAAEDDRVMAAATIANIRIIPLQPE